MSEHIPKLTSNSSVPCFLGLFRPIVNSADQILLNFLRKQWLRMFVLGAGDAAFCELSLIVMATSFGDPDDLTPI